ncbi:putative phenazine biosynthesis PhzF protein [Helianthus annuus]|uniref:Phenazine biosynthesis PhzF protein n=1 Tax=Helianthus annuus TaxID=4232 RepID=A0A251UV44_HELAN|nr:putative phenazine biosynthesis PhzF protein [Helianthus annuus]KAJ0585470.1 putative phenazine biosynthesis PhzF protein [Helianthus annuus]KAJ0920024.1 putative phenazine biosynthesis PhzF protein [Helianthus annuus]KAJ0923708.1 putative phenazine biosynthesis PhzF protein [Helianthus annuus]
MQPVAAEFNLPTTGFLSVSFLSVDHRTEKSRFNLRWFTRVSEVPFCGHATLTTSHFVFESGLVDSNSVEFSTLSGVLTANRISANEINDSEHGFYIELDFSLGTISVFKDIEVSVVSKMLNGVSVVDVLMNNAFDDIVVVLSSAEEVADFKPQFHKIKEGPGRAVIITARAPDGTGFDFYSRVFGPKIGVDEDPVCGSAHCALALYWHEKLGKCDFVVYQVSFLSLLSPLPCVFVWTESMIHMF